MLPLWKPLLTLKNKNNPVIFTELEDKYSTDAEIKKLGRTKVSDEHPFVIFYDDNEDCYYYLKARSFYYHSNKTITKNEKPWEVMVKRTENFGLFAMDSLVDCSQIFKCNRELLESLIDTNDDYYKNTDILNNHYINKIKEITLNCIMQVPPYLSIIEVKLNNNGETYAKSLYLCEEKINEIEEQIKEYPVDVNIDLDFYVSKKDSKYNEERLRYQNGINFCEMFLNEYFPNLLEEFKNIQEINQDNSQNHQGGQKC